VLRLIGRRLLISIPLVLVVTFLTFLLAALAPGDLARTAVGSGGSQAAYEAMRQQLGLNEPLLVRYWNWLVPALRGDLGTDVLTGQPIVAELNQRVPVTFFIIIGVLLLCVIVGMALGTFSAIRGGAIGRAVDVLSMGGLILPSFWVALVLLSVFGVTLKWFPATGYTPLTQDPVMWFLSLVLPVVAVALGAVTTMAKQTRDSVSDVMARDFVRSLRATGVPEILIIVKHGVRNAALPLVTLLGLIVINCISGTVFVEQIFVLPGLGSLAVQSATQNNVPLLQGVTLYFTIFVVAINLLVDISYGWLNPKVRVS
jgi:peptide/nickel transport system permease protein